MRSASSLSRSGVLLIVIISPVLLGSQVRCVFVSNPTVATARIERIDPVMPLVGETVHVSGTGNGTPPLQFAWDFGDGTVAVAGVQAAHAYLAPGSYHLTFTVRDANGNAARDSAQIDVIPLVPTPKLSRVVISRAVAGQPVLFEALPSDENAAGLIYLWTFSDGQSAVGPRAAAIFPVPGMYFASIAVTNEAGEIAVERILFEVTDPRQ
jgi:hypothetical protein